MCEQVPHEVGIPSELHSNGAEELVHGTWDTICQKHRIYRAYNESHSPWQNLAEQTGGIIKSRTRDMMRRINTPLVLWENYVEYNSKLRCMTATEIYDLNGRTPFECVLDFTPDISELVEFSWFQRVWHHDPIDPTKDQLGRWMGPAHNVGQGLAYYILNINVGVVVRSTVSKNSDNDIAPMDLRERQEEFNNRVHSLIMNFQHVSIQRSEQIPADIDDVHRDLFDLSQHDMDELQCQISSEDGQLITKLDAEQIQIKDAPDAEVNDECINTHVSLPYDGDTSLLLGKLNDNPLLDTRLYEVDMPNGTYADYHL